MATTAPERLPLSLSRTQREFVQDEHLYSLFLGGIGAGKSHAGAVKALAQEVIRPNTLGLVVAPTYPMLRDASWRTSLELWGPLIAEVVRSEMRVVFKNGSEAIFRTADDPERLRGPNMSWAWIDEAAICHPDTWKIVIGRLRQHGRAGRAWLTTTPKGMNWVYEVFVTRAGDDTAMFRAATRLNPFLSTDYVRSLTSQYEGEFAAQELEAEFISDQAGALMEWKWLEGARERPAHWAERGGEVVAGIDVAGPGEDETVVYVRQASRILEMRAFQDSDSRGPVLAMLQSWLHKGLKTINADSAGQGWYFVEHLKDSLPATIEVNGVNVGERPSTDEAAERNANLKAELYWALRERFRDGAVSGLTDPLTLSQLSGIRYGHDSRGRVKIESKDDASKRGDKSPDRAEALMLAFAPRLQDQMLATAWQGQAANVLTPDEMRMPWNAPSERPGAPWAAQSADKQSDWLGKATW